MILVILSGILLMSVLLLLIVRADSAYLASQYDRKSIASFNNFRAASSKGDSK